MGTIIVIDSIVLPPRCNGASERCSIVVVVESERRGRERERERERERGVRARVPDEHLL